MIGRAVRVEICFRIALMMAKSRCRLGAMVKAERGECADFYFHESITGRTEDEISWAGGG
jgi:hypothetical protein